MKLILFLILAGASLSSQAVTPSCVDLFIEPRSPTLLKPTMIKGLAEPVYFHNSEVQTLLKDGIDKNSLLKLAQALSDNNTTLIPIDAQGFVAAANVANHPGNYGNFIWHRDFARTAEGLAALPEILKYLPQSQKNKLALAQAQTQAQLAPKAMLRLLEDPQWTQAAIANIRDPGLHRPGDTGQGAVIWIRRLLAPLKENRPPTPEELALERDWGHKQNDALSVFAESVLNALQTGRLRPEDFSPQAQQNLILLAAYFVRLQYSKMWDVGAWEEQLALRTSSIGMVTQFLMRMNEGLKGESPESLKPFFLQLSKSVLPQLEQITDPTTAQLVRELLTPESLTASIELGLLHISSQLSGSRPVETTNDGHITRFEDTALLHMLWSEQAAIIAPQVQLQLIQNLSGLQRMSGYARYEADWFLYGGGEAAKHQAALGLINQLLIPDGHGGWKLSTTEDAAQNAQLHQQQMHSKDMAPVLAATGSRLEAQWTLPDSYLTQIYVRLYEQTQNPEFLQKAQWHFARASGLITGDKETSSEGAPVETWRMPEAYIPIPVLVDQQVTTVFAVSPNSPLNWATAEYIIALQKLLKVMP